MNILEPASFSRRKRILVTYTQEVSGTSQQMWFVSNLDYHFCQWPLIKTVVHPPQGVWLQNSFGFQGEVFSALPIISLMSSMTFCSASVFKVTCISFEIIQRQPRMFGIFMFGIFSSRQAPSSREQAVSDAQADALTGIHSAVLKFVSSQRIVNPTPIIMTCLRHGSPLVYYNNRESKTKNVPKPAFFGD